MDTRRDSGEFDPGGRTAPVAPPAADAVRRRDFDGIDVTTNTVTDLRAAVRSLAAALGANVVN